MTDQVASDSPKFSIARWMWHLPLLFAAMAAPFFLFEPRSASLVSGATGFMYILWPGGAAAVCELWSFVRRAPRQRNEQRVSWRVTLLVMGFQTSVVFMAMSVLMVQVDGWKYWAYGFESWAKFGATKWLVLALLFVGPVLFLRLTPCFARKDGGPASDLLKAIRDQGLGHFYRSWLGMTALVLAIACLVLIFEQGQPLHVMETARNNGRVVSIWDLAIAFPYLPTALLTAVVMLSISRHCTVIEEEDLDALTRTYIDSGPVVPVLDRRAMSALGLTVAVGWAATLFVLLYPKHLAWVAVTTSLAGVTPLTETAKAVEAWVPAQRAAGRSTTEIAAELNRIGSWTPDAPYAGLATLVENPGQVFVDTCSVRIAAGVTDPSSHGAFGWLPAEQAASDLKYCIAVSCASTVDRDAPPALLLASSHDSQATYWVRRWFFDVFADGAAAAPGGYCTTDSRLAGGFQG